MRMVEVVLPFVPVTPMIVSFEAGSPYQFLDAKASARRLLSTSTYGTSASGGSSQRITAAPCAAACGI